MNSTSISLTSYLTNVQFEVVKYLLTPIYVIGTLDNLINILIFSQRSLRCHICSWYFIGVSISHITYLNTGCLPRVIWGWTRYGIVLVSVPACKALTFFTLDGLIISRYLLCLISIDRWIITSRNIFIRQRSSPKIARRLIIGGITFLLILNIILVIGYVIDPNPNRGCAPSTELPYFVYSTIYHTTLSVAPLLILIIFSLFTLFNIRSARHQQISPVFPMTTDRRVSFATRHFRKKDIQFIKLSLIQVAGYILFNTLHGYNTLYGIITQNRVKTTDQKAIDAFVYAMGLNLHYTYTGITFFLYTIASVTFRHALVSLIKSWLTRLFGVRFS